MIIFRKELADAVLDGRKTVTRRLVNTENPSAHWHPDQAPKRCAPGKRHAVVPGRGEPGIGFVTIVNCERETFDPLTISNEEARREGFASHREFGLVWRNLHGNLEPVDVWRVEFKDPEERRA